MPGDISAVQRIAETETLGLDPRDRSAVLEARIAVLLSQNGSLLGRVEELGSDQIEMMGQINSLIGLVNAHSRALMQIPAAVSETSDHIQANTDMLTKLVDGLQDGDEWKAGRDLDDESDD